ncbi:hypothetical protein EH240_20035 [Mesorhizobium tamadayense]|uniref:Uncharacterized protein n=1 Tax=Mesorhizobium tamadayense TaxID=425306 RepID=A0A3P3FK73_9HYPH|nr:hypothetical protein [Mesorhizobium tamadayense]RRH98088.1 hypothetical protein EH240_20035 [Mesorhizobium tamadayense]
MKPYEPRLAGRHVRSTPTGKLVREGEFTDPNATAAPPAEQPAAEAGEQIPAAEPVSAPTARKGK